MSERIIGGFDVEMLEPEENETLIYLQLDKDNNAYLLIVSPDGEKKEFGKPIFPTKEAVSLQALASQWEMYEEPERSSR